MTDNPQVCATQQVCQMIERESALRGISAYELHRRTGIARGYIGRIFATAGAGIGPSVSLDVAERLLQSMGFVLDVSIRRV